MASITIRRIEDRMKAGLRVRAARHGRSMEEEARDILRAALAAEDDAPRNLAQSIRQRFAASGDADLPVVDREPVREPPDFSH